LFLRSVLIASLDGFVDQRHAFLYVFWDANDTNGLRIVVRMDVAIGHSSNARDVDTFTAQD